MKRTLTLTTVLIAAASFAVLITSAMALGTQA
jgi:hypothetical protein